MSVRADDGASYVHAFDIDLGAIVPMVATPGDPRNGVALDALPTDVKIDIAYGGSCTGGKKADMDMYRSPIPISPCRLKESTLSCWSPFPVPNNQYIVRSLDRISLIMHIMKTPQIN